MTSWKGAVLVMAFVAVFVAVYVNARDPESLPRRLYLRYIAHLDGKLHGMLMPTRGQWIVVGQMVCLELVGLVCVGTTVPRMYLVLPVVLVAPALHIEQLRRRRLAQIDKQVDGLLMTLANALRATPNVGNALHYTQLLVECPMRDEIRLTLQEVRLGSSVEQALRHTGARLKSAALDSALMALLIGRQVGGDLTRVLESTANTLREMARLQGQLRAKTAESKAQMFVMALFPLVIVYGFNHVNPGYFEPLLQSDLGRFLLGAAIALWCVSIIVAYRILAVDL
ncbi:MAG TPA: type II secretion system F family protein [Polyangiaceae bacterium]